MVAYSYPPPDLESYAPDPETLEDESTRESTSTVRGAATVRASRLHADPTKISSNTMRASKLHVDPTKIDSITMRASELHIDPTKITTDEFRQQSRYSKAPTQQPTAIKDRLSTIRESSYAPEPSFIPDRATTRFESSRAPTALSSLRPEPTKLATKSFLVTPEDLKMASRQTRIETLPPREREAQEKWAQTQIKATGQCPEGYGWDRRPGGYQCLGGGHGMLDENLADGFGGVYLLRTKDWNEKDGVYYPHPTKPGQFKKLRPRDNPRDFL